MTTLPLWLDLLVAALLVGGALFTLVGAFGLFKLDDLLKRLHGPTKASTLGVGLSLLGSMLWFAWQGEWTGREFLVTAFVFVTAPVSAHVLVSAAMRVVPGCAPPPRPEPRPDP